MNTLKPMSFKEIQKSLETSGHTLRPKTRKKPLPNKTAERRAYERDPEVPGLLVFKPKGQSNLSAIALLKTGHLIAQQKASCFPALALAPPPGSVVLDACAAPGSKTSHLAALMGNSGRILAFDRSPQRVATMEAVLAARGVTNVAVSCANFLDVDAAADPSLRLVTHALLDPSCSSSGMSARPHDDPESVRALAENQLAVVLHAFALPSVERVVYSTCSVLDAENEEVVAKALAADPRSLFAYYRLRSFILVFVTLRCDSFRFANSLSLSHFDYSF